MTIFVAEGGSLPATSDWRVAAIGAISLVLAAIVPVFISKREKKTNPVIPPGYADLEKELRKEITDLIVDNAKKTNKIRVLEGHLWRNGVDPATGRKAKAHE